MPFTCTGARYQFRDNDYATEESSNVTVVVEQIFGSLVPIYLKLTPLTYDQYMQRASQPGSDLASLDTYHGSRPDAAECKCNDNYYYVIVVCNIILVMTILVFI